ncbi:MAG: hypothetical protein HEQ21_14440 [Blastomonas sp.]|uniref:hypothetical protein n=1 Tax=Blastomonas sp. TaxID=1909299 RepID=UPI002583920B|nr:hypothetical protein [Blastomonas sp.]MCO5794017.1 hypothetical protein [Blastomonas sp.]
MKMKPKSPPPGKVEGLGEHRADDTQAYTAAGAEAQFSSMPIEIEPTIHVRRDGALYRLLVLPPQSLPASISRPATHGSHASAMMAAGWLSGATGWPIVDLAKGG